MKNKFDKKKIINPQQRHLPNPKNLRLNTRKTISRLSIVKLVKFKDKGENLFKKQEREIVEDCVHIYMNNENNLYFFIRNNTSQKTLQLHY